VQFIDYLIVGAFLLMAVGAGFFFSRKSSESSRSYFLGSENKWWMLAASGASTNFSVNGTVWNLAILMVLGMKSFWVTLVWWMPNAVFLMAYSGIWIRRCGGMTSAELNKVRFGTGLGAKWARTSFAFMITLFSVSSLCMSYIIVHKFAMVFHCTNATAHELAMAMVFLTSVYVLFGGFKGVIFSEFIQTVVLFSVAFIVGYVCYGQYTADDLHAALTHGSGAEKVTPDYWKSLIPEATPRIGMFEASGYKDWQDFIGATLAFSIVGMIGCVGGAGGRYGEQRFLATRNTREAALMAALWQFLGFPRWIMTAGLCFLGYSLYKEKISTDPECVMPLFLQSGLLKPGLLGLVVAGLSASFMTSFCSEINACASIIVRDLYQPLIRPHVPDSSKELVNVSYMVTGGLAFLAANIGYAMVESQSHSNTSALNVIWGWMLGGLLTCFVVPLALRWYWGRMNGWGFAAGCLAGLVPSLLMLARSFVPQGNILQDIPGNYYTYTTLTVSILACVTVSLVTPPIEGEVTAAFYAKVRPFGLWQRAEVQARELGLPMATALSIPLVALNVVLGLVASFSLYMAPVFFLGHWPMEGAFCAGLFSLSCLALYFSWYKTLPND
jgi:SSS family solute:Na+ symporter